MIGLALTLAVFCLVLVLVNMVARSLAFLHHAIQYHSKPWEGYDMRRVQYIVDHFAHIPSSLKVLVEHPWHNADFSAPTLGWYEYGKGRLCIDTRYVRSERQLVDVLLHEICHHNQWVGKRLNLGLSGSYGRRPAEREAFGFADAWFKVALKMYQSEAAIGTRMISQD